VFKDPAAAALLVDLLLLPWVTATYLNMCIVVPLLRGSDERLLGSHQRQDGLTALHLLSGAEDARGVRVRCIKMLVRQGADVEVCSNSITIGTIGLYMKHQTQNDRGPF